MVLGTRALQTDVHVAIVNAANVTGLQRSIQGAYEQGCLWGRTGRRQTYERVAHVEARTLWWSMELSLVPTDTLRGFPIVGVDVPGAHATCRELFGDAYHLREIPVRNRAIGGNKEEQHGAIVRGRKRRPSGIELRWNCLRRYRALRGSISACAYSTQQHGTLTNCSTEIHRDYRKQRKRRWQSYSGQQPTRLRRITPFQPLGASVCVAPAATCAADAIHGWQSGHQ